MKRVVLHLGLPKTGTTSIQRMLAANRERLGTEHGIRLLLPADLQPLHAAIKAIAQRGTSLGKRRRLRRVIRDMRAECAAFPEPTILLSHEMILGFHSGTMFSTRFDEGPAVAVEALRDVFRGDDLHWALYLRDRESQKRSAYNQNVKVRYVATDFAEWRRVACPPGVFDQLISDLQAHLGARLTLVDYDAERRKGGFWGQPVLALAGVDAADLAAFRVPSPVNESLPPRLLDLKRRANALGLTKPQAREVLKLLEEALGTEAGEKGRDTGADASAPVPEDGRGSGQT